MRELSAERRSDLRYLAHRRQAVEPGRQRTRPMQRLDKLEAVRETYALLNRGISLSGQRLDGGNSGASQARRSGR